MTTRIPPKKKSHIATPAETFCLPQYYTAMSYHSSFFFVPFACVVVEEVR